MKKSRQKKQTKFDKGHRPEAVGRGKMSKNKVYYRVRPNPCLQCKVSCREKKC